MSPPRIVVAKSFSVALLLVAVAIPVCAQPSAGAKQLRAGTAKVKITPWLGISLNGGMRDRAATEVHDDLHARALVLDNGETQLAIVVCDSCMIMREVIDNAKGAAEKATGIPASHMLCSATHAHSAPSSASVFQSEADPRYQKFLSDKIAAAIEAAQAELQPAKIGWGTGTAPEHVHNRRWHLKPGSMPPGAFPGRDDFVKMNPPRGSDSLLKPAGPIDPVVSVLSVQTASGKPLCLLANYSLHYVGGTGAGHVSADYFGAFASKVEHELTAKHGAIEGVLGIMSNGTSGDINNIDFRQRGERKAPYEQINDVADAVAAEALKVYEGIEHRDWVPLDARQSELTFKVRKPTAEEVAQARQIVAAAAEPVMRSLPEVYARETILMDQFADEVDLIVQAFRIGDCGIAAIPCETFVEIGLELREKSPLEQTFTIELANGYNGYLPTPAQHDLRGYETWRARSSYLERTASPVIVKELTHHLSQLAK